jgi:hypothetical protein
MAKFYGIKDADGQEHYTAKMTLFGGVYLRDTLDTELAHIKMQTLKKRGAITVDIFQDGVIIASLQSKDGFEDEFLLAVQDTHWTVTRTTETQYDITTNGGEIISLLHHQGHDGFLDEYRMDIEEGGPDILLLSTALAIDYIEDSRRAVEKHHQHMVDKYPTQSAIADFMLRRKDRKR